MCENYTSIHCKHINKAIKYEHGNKASVCIPRLHYSSLRITAYSDADFANNGDLSPQLGPILLMTDDSHNTLPVSYQPYKSWRVFRSIPSSEVIVFADLFDAAFAIRKKLKFVLRQSKPIHMLTNTKSIFDIVSKWNSHKREANYAWEMCRADKDTKLKKWVI